MAKKIKFWVVSSSGPNSCPTFGADYGLFPELFRTKDDAQIAVKTCRGEYPCKNCDAQIHEIEIERKEK